MALNTDLDRLAQVFINLIANAQKYCDAERPELTVSVHDLNGKVAVDFIDNGSGIPKEVQAVVFEKFFRISGEKAGGAGLGLVICREIMHRLGGEVAYLGGHSGSAFRVSLLAESEVAAR